MKKIPKCTSNKITSRISLGLSLLVCCTVFTSTVAGGHVASWLILWFAFTSNLSIFF